MFKRIIEYIHKQAYLNEEVFKLQDKNFKQAEEIKILKHQLEVKSETLKQLNQKTDKGSGSLYCVFKMEDNQELDLYKIYSSKDSAILYIDEMKQEFPENRYIWEPWTLRK